MDYLLAPERLETERFVLRSYMPGDGRLLAEAANASHEYLAPWLTYPPSELSVEDAERDVRRFRAHYLLAKYFHIGVFAPDGSALLGGGSYASLDIPPDPQGADLGLWIHVDHAGKGLGTEVLRAMVRWGFSEWPWQRLGWRCDSRNVASIRIAEKAGMAREGLLRNQQTERGDERRDTVILAAIRGEWSDPG